MPQKATKASNHTNLKWLLPVLLIILVLIFIFHPMQKKYEMTTANSEPTTVPNITYKTYTNKIGTVSLQYPSTWSVKEVHTMSNRTVDNPKEINTGLLTGPEGEVTVEWGPMGFGGGCNEQKKFAIKTGEVQICDVIDENGGEQWQGFSNGHTDDTITGVRAAAYKPLSKNSQTVKTILSSISFK